MCIFQKWQKEWENSPRKERAFSHKHRNLSDGINLSAVDLDKAYTASTSLPESLDEPPDFPAFPVPKEKARTADTGSSGSATTLKSNVSVRSQPVPKVPESTGKFGSTNSVSNESVTYPNKEKRLETITENPLSRPNTVETGRPESAARKLREYPNLTQRIGTTQVSPATSHSTASVGLIHLQNSFNTLRSSNASIFDDPSWLSENTKSSTDHIFHFMRNLQAGLGKTKEKDPKWFLKTPVKPYDNRKDLNYTSMKANQYTGLNSTNGWNVNRSQSLQIIRKGRELQLEKRKAIKSSKRIGQPTTQHSERSLGTV